MDVSRPEEMTEHGCNFRNKSVKNSGQIRPVANQYGLQKSNFSNC